jgi:hypothetical protein
MRLNDGVCVDCDAETPDDCEACGWPCCEDCSHEGSSGAEYLCGECCQENPLPDRECGCSWSDIVTDEDGELDEHEDERYI